MIPKTIKQLEVTVRGQYWFRTVLDSNGDKWVYMRDVDAFIGAGNPGTIPDLPYVKGREIDLGHGPENRACILLTHCGEYLLHEFGKVTSEGELLYEEIEMAWREWFGVGVRDPDGPLRHSYKLIYRNMIEVMEMFSTYYNLKTGEVYTINKTALYKSFLKIIMLRHHVDYEDLNNMELIGLMNVMSSFTAMVLHYLSDRDLQEIASVHNAIPDILNSLEKMLSPLYSTLDVIDDLLVENIRSEDLLYST